jgi:hypothetical protein
MVVIPASKEKVVFSLKDLNPNASSFFTLIAPPGKKLTGVNFRYFIKWKGESKEKNTIKCIIFYLYHNM